MENADLAFKEEWINLIKKGDEELVKKKFISLVPEGVPGIEIYNDVTEVFSGEELAEVCAEIILTVFSKCSSDDFHSWNYEHLSFIIELSNKYGVKITEQLLNGLPQQLLLRVKTENLNKSECD